MGTKTISISDEAYGILKSKKEGSESFSEVIVKLTGKSSLSSFAGVLGKTADLIEKDILKTRALHRNLHKKRVQRDFR